MIYPKSALAGLLAVVAATIVLPILAIMAIVVYTAIHPPLEGSIGWDPVSLVHPARGRLPLKLRAFLDFAAPRLKARLAMG